MFDIGQIELLRGPQGTLRGRASPSGSMTVTTHRPDMVETGGYIDVTGTDIRGRNANGAFNLPIIDGVLAVRVAALYDENEYNRVESFNSSIDPRSRTEAGRLTVRYEPTDSLSLQVMYQNLVQDTRYFDQVESAFVVQHGWVGARLVLALRRLAERSDQCCRRSGELRDTQSIPGHSSPDRNWDVSLYGKNITDAERVLTRSSTPLTTIYNQLATALTGITTYRQINFTAPREFGLNVRYSFGSR